jgi:hypothetical protein
MSDGQEGEEVSEQPTYLGPLNLLSLAETTAAEWFTAWAGVTSHSEVRSLLEVVAEREAEHGRAFAKRISDLGFELTRPDAETVATNQRFLDIACSEQSDLQKFEAFGFTTAGHPDQSDVYDGLLDKDRTVDPETGALLGRYVAEDRDSGRMVRAQYERMTAERLEA